MTRIGEQQSPRSTINIDFRYFRVDNENNKIKTQFTAILANDHFAEELLRTVVLTTHNTSLRETYKKKNNNKQCERTQQIRNN